MYELVITTFNRFSDEFGISIWKKFVFFNTYIIINTREVQDISFSF